MLGTGVEFRLYEASCELERLVSMLVVMTVWIEGISEQLDAREAEKVAADLARVAIDQLGAIAAKLRA